MESNPSGRVYISIPPFYLEYFFTKWPDHPLKGTPADKLCIQALRSMQGLKDAGRKLYLLLKGMCINELGRIVSTYDNTILSWSYNNHKALLAISTDDFLMATSHRSLYDKLKQCCDGYFNYTAYESNIIRYLNTRIIISTYGIIPDITDHICRNVLQDYWVNYKPPFQSSPFPLKNAFEYELFIAPLLTGKDLNARI
eukprot:15354239-Ditylum_brightwellii.AAC.1